VGTVVLRTADGRRADPATPGIRRLMHRPGGVLAHWRRDGCGQPVPGTINARRPYAGQRVLAVMMVVLLQPAPTSSYCPRTPATTILCRCCGCDGGSSDDDDEPTRIIMRVICTKRFCDARARITVQGAVAARRGYIY